MVDTKHILNSVKSGMELALKYAEAEKNKYPTDSITYWMAEGEINGINGCLSTIELALKLIE